ncbi:MAG: hypothetical protein IT371_12350 [Deltaproteobacteria bacterium]|nr:hypothetical protein [Deltaproteobacteria bacterium]
MSRSDRPPGGAPPPPTAPKPSAPLLRHRELHVITVEDLKPVRPGAAKTPSAALPGSPDAILELPTRPWLGPSDGAPVGSAAAPTAPETTLPELQGLPVTDPDGPAAPPPEDAEAPLGPAARPPLAAFAPPPVAVPTDEERVALPRAPVEALVGPPPRDWGKGLAIAGLVTALVGGAAAVAVWVLREPPASVESALPGGATLDAGPATDDVGAPPSAGEVTAPHDPGATGGAAPPEAAESDEADAPPVVPGARGPRPTARPGGRPKAAHGPRGRKTAGQAAHRGSTPPHRGTEHRPSQVDLKDPFGAGAPRRR